MTNQRSSREVDAREQLGDRQAEGRRQPTQHKRAGPLTVGLVVRDVRAVDRRVTSRAERSLGQAEPFPDLPQPVAERGHGAHSSTAWCSVKHLTSPCTSTGSASGLDVANLLDPATLKRIKALREARGVSHEACARALGLTSRSQYTRRESGNTDLTWEEIDALRRFLGAPNPWPHVELVDAYDLEGIRRRREAGVVAAAEGGGMAGRLVEWLIHEPGVRDDVAAEMNRRAHLDVGPWDDGDIALIRVIAERHVLPPASSPQPGRPGAAGPARPLPRPASRGSSAGPGPSANPGRYLQSQHG